MNDYDISVLLPVYNDSAHLETAIESVIGQEGASFELIVVDDGSTDDSANVLATYEDRQDVEILEHDENRGLASALNTALDAANGRFVARQDADDRSLPGRLRSQVEYLRANPETDVVAAGVNVISDSGDVLGGFAAPANPAEKLDRYNPIVHGSIMARKAAIRDSGGYDPFFRYRQDYELWVRLTRRGYCIDGMDETLYELRRSSGLVLLDERREKIGYSLIARAPEDTKTRLKSIAKEDGIRAVFSHLDSDERAAYHRRMVRAYVEHGHRIDAIRSGILALRLAPDDGESYRHLLLALIPRRIGTRILSAVSGREGGR
ncbi:glycosyltransferase [Natronomonas halophila]|uniref:glycosyltransferase n=1 Tax=Natronomonas halophila TaxID=2747817 RepID=UPI0015B49166|nr:glycosyltransferase [Natronomonas halophila]QLD86846.1 glycosyltransferase [Natronomonas halophila]